MSDPAITEPQLPRAPVLAYLTQTKTAVRARAVTAIFSLLLGIAALTLGLWVLFSSATQVYDLAKAMAAVRGGAITMDDMNLAFDVAADRWKWSGFRVNPFLVAPTLAVRLTFILWLSLPALLLVLFSLLVWRGRATACRLAAYATIPLMFPVMLAAALIFGWATVMSLRIFGGPPEPGAWLWFFAVPPCLLLVLLMKDLCAYLLWFSRQPHIDKPRVHFISGREKPPP